MHKRKDILLLLLHTSALSSCTVDLLLHLQYYQRSGFMISKVWVKSKFLQQSRYNNLLTEKWVRKITFLKYSFLWKHTATVNLKKFCSNTIIRLYNWEKFYLVNVNYFREDVIRWKRGFQIFFIGHYTGDIGNKNTVLT